MSTSTTEGTADAGAGTDTVHHRTCPLCEAGCGLELTVRNDTVVRIRGDRDNAFSRGFICPKGSALHHLHADPDRLRRPLVRRGDDPATATWEEVTWDEAFAVVEAGLRGIIERHGRDAVAIYLGNPSVHSLGPTLFNGTLVKALGTTNVFSASTVDQMPKHVSSGYLYGNPLLIPVPDLDRTDHLLILGANPYASNGSLCTAPDFPGRLEAIQARGGKVTVVDPRRTETADHADEWVPIRPGADAHLLMAMAQVLFADDLVDLGGLSEHVSGLDELRAAVGPFTPEAVAPSRASTPPTIRRLAHELAAAPTASVYGRIGTHTAAFGTIAAWAVDVLNACTGNLDRPGGAMFATPAHDRGPGSGKGRGFVTGRRRSRVSDHPEVRGELPVVAMAEEITTPGEGQVRALVTVAGNPAVSAPNSAAVEAALGQLEFMVSVDPYRNETTRFADVILPPPSALERSEYHLAFFNMAVRNVAEWAPPLLRRRPGPRSTRSSAASPSSPPGPRRATTPPPSTSSSSRAPSARAIAAPGSPVADRDGRRAAGDRHRRPDPLDPRPHGRRDDPHRRLRRLVRRRARRHLPRHAGGLAPRRSTSARSCPGCRRRCAHRPAPSSSPRPPCSPTSTAWPPASTHPTRTPTPCVLIGRRQLRSNNSWMHNVNVLAKGRYRCTLLVHPDDAARLGLEHGADAEIRSRVGAVIAPVEVTDAMSPGVVSLPHGWGHDRPGAPFGVAGQRPGVNSNLLTDDTAIDPLSGNAVLNGIPVTVSPSSASS